MKSFLSKKSILRTMAVAAVCMLGATSVKAQEFTIQGDFVSMAWYLSGWRSLLPADFRIQRGQFFSYCMGIN